MATQTHTPSAPAPEPTPQSASVVALSATEFAYRTAGLNQSLRDLADLIHGSIDENTNIDAAEVLGWVFRLDSINNLAAEGTDEFSDRLRSAGIAAPLNWGTVIRRPGL